MKKRKSASTRKTPSTRKLVRYHDKRDFARTPEQVPYRRGGSQRTSLAATSPVRICSATTSLPR